MADELRKNLLEINYPLNKTHTDQKLIEMVFKHSKERWEFLKWVAGEIKGTKITASFSKKDLVDIFSSFVYIPNEFKECFIEGTCSQENQKKIWKAIFKDLKVQKSLTDNITLDQIVDFLKETTSSLRTSNELKVSPKWDEVFGAGESFPDSKTDDNDPEDSEIHELLAELDQACEDAEAPEAEVKPMPDMSDIGVNLTNLLKEFSSKVKEISSASLLKLEFNEDGQLASIADSLESISLFIKNGLLLQEMAEKINELKSSLSLLANQNAKIFREQ